MHEIFLGALLVLSIGWLILRIRRNQQETQTAARPRGNRTGAYHAVAIKYSENACEAAKALTGRRFLSNAAPRLPLPDCDHLECRCRFTHFQDRRSGRDRRSPFAPSGTSGTTGSFQTERRERADRRRQPPED